MLILQFKSLVILKQIQFLSHQAKIASKIELYTYAPQSTMELPNTEELPNLKFKRIGYLSLDSNERSEFTARELKSVYIDAPAAFLKVALHKCHVNKYNIFNQVGMIAINCLGEAVDAGEHLPEAPAIGQMLEEANSYDTVTLEKMKMLNAAKEKAVSEEDFDEAKRIKDIMDKLKAVGKQLSALEQKKRLAIQNEDYESAKILKVEIDRLRSSAFEEAPGSAHGGRGSKKDCIPISQEYVLEDQKNPDLPTGHNKVLKDIMPMRAPGASGFPGDFPGGEEIKGPSPSEIPSGAAPGPESADPPAEKEEDPLRGSLAVPAVLHKGKPQPAQEYGEEQPPEGQSDAASKAPQTKGSAEALSAQAKKLAEPYYTLLELSLLEKLFSKNWGFREGGINDISQELASKNFVKITMSEEEKIFVNLVGLMGYMVSDKVTQVSLRAMGAIDELLKFFPYEVQSFKSLYNSNVDSCLVSLLEKIGDSNPKVRSKVEETCVKLATQGNVPFSTFISHITKTGKKSTTSTKHLQGKLNLLIELVKQFGVDSESSASQSVIDYALAGAKNSNADIRNAGYALLVEVYKRIGGTINGYLGDLRPAQKEMLQAEFDKVSGGSAPVPAKRVSSKQTVTTNVQPHGGSVKISATAAAAPALEDEEEAEPAEKSPAAAAPEEKELPSSPAARNSKACEYCGKCDEAFTQDSMDLHMYNECPMLFLCSSCGSIIEIININNHLLNECSGKADYKQCPVCHEAILKNEMDTHVEEGACKPPESNSVRCPLCHMDISPASIEAWRDHILVKQCPNNERRPL